MSEELFTLSNITLRKLNQIQNANKQHSTLKGASQFSAKTRCFSKTWKGITVIKPSPLSNFTSSWNGNGTLKGVVYFK